ncbi:MAG: hypothetical protein ACK5LM_03775 [Lactovum sp.]
MVDKNKKTFLAGIFNGNDNKDAFEEKENLTSQELDMDFEHSFDSENYDELEGIEQEYQFSTEIEETGIASEELTEMSDFSTDFRPVSTISHIDYSRELSEYKSHQREYQASKVNYDKILNEYENLKADLELKLSDFNPLQVEVTDRREQYGQALLNYKESKLSYEEDVKGYQFTVEEKKKVSQKIVETDEELEILNSKLEEIKDVALQTAQLYEEKSNENSEDDAELKVRKDKLSMIIDDLEILSNKFEELKIHYDEAKPRYDEIKDRYDFMSQIKDSYQTLSAQFEKMHLQERAAKQNYDDINNLLEENESAYEVAKQVDEFTIIPLGDIDENYKNEREDFQKIESSYQDLKDRFDTESTNFARIAKNYADLTNSDNANRVALHYVTEEYTDAKSVLEKISNEFKPIEREYLKKKSAFSIIDDNYAKMSEVVRAAQQNLTESKRRYMESQRTYSKVEEVYEYVRIQNTILKQDLAAKEAQYSEVADNYEEVVVEFEKEKESYIPLNETYQDTVRNIEDQKEKLAIANQSYEEAQKKFELSSGQLDDMRDLLAEVREKLENLQKDVNETQEVKDKLEKKKSEIESVALSTLGSGQSKQEVINSKYQDLFGKHDAFTAIHMEYARNFQEIDKDYQRVSSLSRLANDEFDIISLTYQNFVEHGHRVSRLYEEVMTSYESDKDYYDLVYAEYQKVQVALNQAKVDKDSFDLATSHMRALLLQNNSLTFPIYESTGYNYVDAFNLPTLMRTARNSLSLKEKPQLNEWMDTYHSVRSELSLAINRFASSLNNYQDVYTHYRRVGGERLESLDSNDLAYSGIDLASYLNNLDAQIEQWQREYFKREGAFTVLLNAYISYLDREKQLLSLVSGNSDIQTGVQEVINLTNSIPEYNDMYGSGYGDISRLSRYLNLPADELTKPKTAQELLSILYSNYYQKALSMAKKNVSSFSSALNRLKGDYEDSLKNLNKEMAHFQVTTEIPTEAIQVKGIINDSFNFESYLKACLDRNYELLKGSVTDVSSLVNVIRRAGELNKVANRSIDTSADNTLLFPDKSIKMSDRLLQNEVLIYEPKNMPIPIEPDQPTSAILEPVQPSELMPQSEYIYLLEEPELISTNINDLVEQ